MERAQHLERLRTMLRQVVPGADESTPATELESTRGRVESIEGVPEEKRAAAIEGLRRLSATEFLRDDTIDGDQQHALEAIILPKERPAVLVVGDTFSPPPFPWEHLGSTDFKSRIDKVIPLIGRIEVPKHPSVPYGGTGFVVGPNLLMTNRHVAEIFTSGLGHKTLMFRTAAVDFKREILPTTPQLLTVTKVVMIHPYWDMALLEVSGLSGVRAALTVSTKAPAELNNREVVVIGYPARDWRNNVDVQNEVFGGMFEVKRMQPGRLKEVRTIESFGHNVAAITHDASTLGGNSGSAVIDVLTGEVLALHFAGLYLDANFGVPMYELARDSRVVQAGLNFQGSVAATTDWAAVWKLADRGTETPTPQPSMGGGGGHGEVTVVAAGGANVPQLPSGNSVSMTIPLNITVSLGTPTVDGGDSVPVATAPVAPARPTARETIAAQESGLEGVAEEAVIQAYNKFDPASLQSSTFSWKASITTAVCSHLAYEKSEIVEATMRQRYQMQSCEFVQNDDTECFVAANADTIIVAFRGTAGTADWIGNLKFINTSTNYGELHRGFYFGFQAVKSNLEQLIRAAGSSTRKLVITGHSLGGALATVAAAEWQGVFNVASVHTFGQPRVGRPNFVAHIQQHYGSKFYRIVNDDDIVTRVPPWYGHVGVLRHFGPTGAVSNESLAPPAAEQMLATEAPALSETEFAMLQASLQLPALGPATEGVGLEGFLPSFSDHKIANYMTKILTQQGV